MQTARSLPLPVGIHFFYAYEALRHEIDEHKQTETELRQSQKMEAVGTLAGGIAHDFNNILGGIIGFGEMIEEDLPPESKTRKYVQRVLTPAERGKDLVRQILVFSRKSDTKRLPVSLTSVIKDTMQLLRSSIPSTIEIRLDLASKHDTILSTPTELQQILINLATNATFAMRQKGGKLSITTMDLTVDLNLSEAIGVHPGEYTQLVVTDTGIGIPSDIRERIFEPFFTTKDVGCANVWNSRIYCPPLPTLPGQVQSPPT